MGGVCQGYILVIAHHSTPCNFFFSVLPSDTMGRRSVAQKTLKRKKQKLKKKINCKRKLIFPKAKVSNSDDQFVAVITPPLTPAEDVPVNQSFTLCSEVESSDEDDHCWDDLREEAAQLRQFARNKEILRRQCYGKYIDSTPAILEDSTSIPKAIEKLSPIDRTTVRTYIHNLEQKEQKAVRLAQFFRNRNGLLEHKYLQQSASAHKVREGVRYFWQHQLLEGASRSGLMVKHTILNNQKHDPRDK